MLFMKGSQGKAVEVTRFITKGQIKLVSSKKTVATLQLETNETLLSIACELLGKYSPLELAADDRFRHYMRMAQVAIDDAESAAMATVAKEPYSKAYPHVTCDSSHKKVMIITCECCDVNLRTDKDSSFGANERSEFLARHKECSKQEPRSNRKGDCYDHRR